MSEPGADVEAILAEARARVAAMPPPTLGDHLDALDDITACSCDPYYANRDLLDPHCRHDYRPDVDAMRAALEAPR